MAQAGFGITQANLLTIGAAGLGAVGTGLASTFIPVANPMTRNIILAVGGAVIAGMGKGPFRALGIGLGAVAVADIVRTFMLRQNG